MKNKIGYLLLSKNAQANKKEIETTTLPFTFTADGKRLYNYRIYGNMGGVGDLDSTTNKYIIPVTIDDSTTNISLPAPLMKINADSDYIEYRTQKITRKIFKVEANADNIRRTNDHAWYIVKNHPTLKSASGNDTVNIYCNMLSNGTTANTDVCFINNTGTIRFNTENAYSTVSDLLEDFEGLYFWVIHATAGDYEEQNVSIPPLFTAEGENSIDFSSTIKPSKVYLQGNISVDEIQSASLQSLSPQNLKTMDSNDEMSLDVMPIDSPNLKLNDISETVGGEESAE